MTAEPTTIPPDASAAEAAPQGTPERIDALAASLASLGAQLAKVQEVLARVEGDFLGRFKSDDKLQVAFDKLYEEMQQYKDDFVFQAQKPLLIDLIGLHDAMCLAHGAADEAARDAIDTLREQLLELLYRRDVEPIDLEPGALKFDRDSMKVIKRVPVTDPAEDQLVEKVLRQGFKWNSRLLRPHEVVVKRHGA